MDHGDNEELLEPFLHALESRKALEIPRETVLGAITHFLSTLSQVNLPRFINAILASDYLWASDEYEEFHLGQAVSLAVSAKVEIWEKRHKTYWCASRKVTSACRRWLDTIQSTLETSNTPERTLLEIRTGLLAGLASNQHVKWGDGRTNLEEAVVLGVSELGLPTAGQRELAIVCEAVQHIEGARLRVLDLQAILPFIQNALAASLDQDRHSHIHPSQLAVALGRIFEVLSGGNERDRAFMWESVNHFVQIMRNRTEKSESPKKQDKMSDRAWNSHKTALFAFLVPSSKIIDILLRNADNVATSKRRSPADLCIEIILTLAAFSSITQQTEGGLEGHDRVLFGSLDILVASSGAEGIERLFRTLIREQISDARAPFVLRCGELVVKDMDNSTLVRDLLPLTQSYIHQPQTKAAFDASHAFIAALITSIGQSDIRPLPHAAFAAELAPYYTRLLIQQLLRGDITADHFESTYPPTVGLASKIHDDHALNCIDQLDALKVDAKHRHSAMLTRIATAQYITTGELTSYLDRLADDISDTPAGDQRLELAAKAFGMVVRELGDQEKKIGIEWWLERKSQIEGKSDLQTYATGAKL